MDHIPNNGFFAGKTIFISGASRGIGLAIAKKLARDGANIVVAAKTTIANAKLPGTIYSAAKEIEAEGGNCLPVVMDVRSEESIERAIQAAVKRFGGLDILINNASAISLTNTEVTNAKRFDLMYQCNVRGTFLLTRVALPYLKNSSHSHILNISPPLSMLSQWFKHHCAYTISKYGMSMLVLGMAEEFRCYGVAVNALWPRTAVYTAAMKMLKQSDGIEVMATCRKPEIMSDAAYVLLSQSPIDVTGRFALDDSVLAEAGISDFSSYAFDPSTSTKLNETNNNSSKLDVDLFVPGHFYSGPQEFCAPRTLDLNPQSKL
ncbi:Hydroxysteroid dehydrogenase-like protein 2 [Aphelenchoides besseyi]|nr:Hydroxysteroid dehydrogenase-like protein 2 [Aphelenchoides besseyi]